MNKFCLQLCTIFLYFIRIHVFVCTADVTGCMAMLLWRSLSGVPSNIPTEHHERVTSLTSMLYQILHWVMDQHVWVFGCRRRGSEMMSKTFVMMSSVISIDIQMCCTVWVTLERQLFTPHDMRFGTSYSNRPVKMLVISSILKNPVFMLYHLQVEFRQASDCSHNWRLHYIECMSHSAWNHTVTWELYFSGIYFGML